MSFRLVPKSVTLNDLERHSQVAAVDPFGLSWAFIISEIISQFATCVLLCDNQLRLFIYRFVCKFAFHVVLFELC